MSYSNRTAWNDNGKYYWADLDDGPAYGPFRSFPEAQENARLLAGDPRLTVYGSCPARFCRPSAPMPACFTQEMAETYGDNR